MSQQFTHLHVHTEASLLDGLARLKEIFKAAAENGQSALAVTDHGTMGGLWKAKEAAKAAGVKPIPGVEIYLAVAADGTFGSRYGHTFMETSGDLADDSDENEGAQKKRHYYHLTLLATSRKGWENLIRITNAAEQTRWSKYPMADLALLAENTEGLIALTGCLGGPVLSAVAGGNIDLARQNLSTLVDTFGKDNLFLEVMDHGIRVETAALPKMWQLGQELDVPLVATNDSHFTHDHDAHAHDAWLALRTLSGKATAEEGVRPIDDPKRYRFTGEGYHLRSTQEMYELFNPERRGFGALTMSSSQLLALRASLENESLLPLMLRPTTVDQDLVTRALEWVQKGGAIEDEELTEFILRAERETFYLNTFGKPSEHPEHPRRWWREACAVSQQIADRVADDVIPDGNALLPIYPLPDGEDSSRKYLFRQVLDGARRIYGDELPQEVRDRLNEEWEVITFMGFEDYFLIVWDVCSWAKSTRPILPGGPEKAPILVGPGRGSGAGSMIAYCLGITGLDPLRHDLLFERFIERGRSDWPDFDIDFERNRRDDILDYLEGKWGEGHVAQIGSYGVSKSRRAVKDAARLLGQTRIGAQLTKVIPVEGGNPLGFDQLLDPENAQTAEFRRVLAQGGAEALEVLELAQSFDNVINGASIHACGIIISDRYLPDLIPLRQNKKTLPDGTERVRLVTQWDSKDCEKFGLLKLDILALRNLDIMHTAFDYIAAQTGEVLTMETIPHPSIKGDPRVDKAWALLRDGRTAGIFQAEGAAMTQLIQDVQPETEEHLSAIYALFRPGPISAGMPEHYGLRKNGKEAVSYDMYTSDATEAEWLDKQLGSSYAILCVTGDTMVYSIDRGHEVPIRDIRLGEKVQGVDELNRPAPGTVSALMENGVKRIVETHMAGGRSLRSTPDHPVLTPTGWREVGELTAGDVIAAPWTLLGDDTDGTAEERARGYALGLLLGDGSLKHTTQVALYGVDAAVFDAWDDALMVGFGATAARYVGTRGVIRSHVSGVRGGKTAAGGPGATPNPVLAWLRDLGLKDAPNGGRGSYDKFVPAAYLAAPVGVVKRILAGLWDTDGTFSTTRSGPSAGYKTTSKRLAFDVVHLLQRVGIAATVSTNTPATGATAYHVGVVDVRELCRTLAPLMSQQSRREVAERWAVTDLVRRNHRSSTVPNSVVREHLTSEGISTSAFRATGRTGYGRLSAFAETTGSDDFARLSNVRWVPIVDQTDAGEEAVYDITVDGPHSFIANGIVIHNCFQEQMMLLGTTIAGFDAGQRSALRRAIGKKDKVKMAEVKEYFLAGAIKEFRDESGTVFSPVFRQDTADRIWAMFEGAASYAFNKSHSMAYAYLGYFTAFLKANWPGAYGAAILANTTETERRVEALLALPAEGIEVLAPDVNLSGVHSTPEGADKVRIGLSEVAGVSGSGEYIVRERNSGGEFRNLTDLAKRVDVEGKGLPSNQVTGLIEAGAMDEFGPRYGLAMVARLATPALPGPVPSMEYGVIERSARQRQRLGVSLGTHPLVVFNEQVREWSKPIETAYGVIEEKGIPIGKIPNEAGAVVTVIGLLAQFNEGSYKGGRKAAIVLEGSSARVDGIMWDRELSEQRQIGIPPIGWPVAVTAKVGIREYEQEDDEGNITLVKVRQLTIRRIDVVDIFDPITGSLPSDVVVPVLSHPEIQHQEPPAAPELEFDLELEAPDFAAPPPEHFNVDLPFDSYLPEFDDVPEAAEGETPRFTRPRTGVRNQQDVINTIPASMHERRAILTPPGRVTRNTNFTYTSSDGRVIAYVDLTE